MERDNSGILFRNDRKEKETHPDYTGKATVDGVEYYMSAWIKDGRKGKFMSFAFKPQNEAPRRQESRQQYDDRNPPPPLDDEIPF